MKGWVPHIQVVCLRGQSPGCLWRLKVSVRRLKMVEFASAVHLHWREIRKSYRLLGVSYGMWKMLVHE